MIRCFAPTPAQLRVSEAILRQVWRARERQRQLKGVKQEIKKPRKRLVEASGGGVQCIFEIKTADQIYPSSCWKRRLPPVALRKAQQKTKSNWLTFLANLWELWETDEIKLRRAVFKSAFAKRVKCCRTQKLLTPEQFSHSKLLLSTYHQH